MKIGVLATYDGILAGHFVSALLDRDVAIDCVLLDPKPTAPRDLALHEQRTCGLLPILPLSDLAAARIPLFAVPSHNDPLMHDLVRERGIDALINAGTPRVLSGATLAAAPLGVLNCHPGLLPQYRGSSCVEWALFYGDRVGNSVHLMTASIDEGPLLCSEPVEVPTGASYSQIRVAVYKAGFDLLARVCRGLQTGQVSIRDFVAQSAGRRHLPIDEQSMNVVRSRYPEAA